MANATRQKSSKGKPCNARPTKPGPLKLTGHYETLAPEETDEVVDTVAGMVVNFIKVRGKVPTVVEDEETRSGAQAERACE